MCSIKVLSDYKVHTSLSESQQYEILSGLKPGDRVVFNGYDKFGDVEEL